MGLGFTVLAYHPDNSKSKGKENEKNRSTWERHGYSGCKVWVGRLRNTRVIFVDIKDYVCRTFWVYLTGSVLIFLDISCI